MDTVKIKYGDETGEVRIDVPFKVLSPCIPEIRNEKKVLAESLDDPIGKESLAEFLEGAKDLLVIVNDATRGTPTAKILDHIWPIVTKVPNNRFIVAVGTHPASSEDELGQIFKHHYKKVKDKIIIHDSGDPDNLTYLGTTTRGTPVYLNKLAVEASRILTISNVEPHYFAGYSGGRKSILPGIAGFDTVEKNHSHALSTDSYPLALEGNPVHEDMMEVADLLDPQKIYTIQTVLTKDKKIYAAFCGGIHEAFYKAVEISGEINCSRLDEKADIVITCVAPPKDINLYQSQHALENGKLALKKEGIIIWVSKSRKGIGNDTFMRLLGQVENYDDVKESLRQGYKLGYHKAAKIMELKTWADVWTVTGLDDQIILDAKMKPYHDIQTALDDAISQMRKRGTEPTVIVMPDGGGCVPLLSECI